MEISNIRPDPFPRDIFQIFLIDVFLMDGEIPYVYGSEKDFYSNSIVHSTFEKPDEEKEDMENENNEKICNILLFGCTPEGQSVYVECKGYKPWVRIEIPDSWQNNDIEIWKKKTSTILGDFEIQKEYLKRFYGFVPQTKKNKSLPKKFTYLNLFFPTLAKAQKAFYILQNSYEIFKKIKVTDKSTKWKTKCLNDLNIGPSSWFSIRTKANASGMEDVTYTMKSYSTLQRKSTCQYEIFCSIENIECCTFESIPPLVMGSFDGEMFSFDGSFPNPCKGDKTIYLGLSVQKYGSSKITRYVFGEGLIQMKNDADFVYVPCKDSKDIVETFRDYIVYLDLDLITGWNTYGFDFIFLQEDYLSYATPIHLRGTQDLNTEYRKSPSVHDLYNELKKLGTVHFEKWQKKAQKEFGIRKLFYLEKECKKFEKQQDLLNGDSKDGIKYQSLFKKEELECEEDEFVSMLGIESIDKIRTSLLIALKGEGEAFRFLEEERSSIQKKNPFSQSLQNENPYFTRECLPLGRGFMTSRLAHIQNVELYEKKMNSMAKGENIYSYWDMHGRINVDLMQVIKDDLQPEDNSLKSAAKSYLADPSLEKIDLSAKQMFDHFRSQDLSKLFDIAQYCSRDCDIPLRIIEKLHYVPTWVELSRVSNTSVHDIINSGQQTRIINLISKFIKGEYSLNQEKSGWPSFYNDKNEYEENEYQGATVIEPIAGFYAKNCIITMDFESLYPSIMRFFNLCPSTLILDPAYSIIPSKEIHTINHGPFQKQYSFVNHVDGVIPKLLKHLITARKAVKKQMAGEKDPFQAALLNGRQNGLKRVCNSVYGFFGVSESTGVLPCKPIAAVTTLKGRAFIEATKNYVESMYEGCVVIYGDTDSVMIKCPEHIKLQEAMEFGEKLSKEITQKLQSGGIKGLGGAGDLLLESLNGNENIDQQETIKKKIQESCNAMNLAFEKVYTPYLLLKKKRYAGMKYIGNKCTMEMKGVDCIRRDRPKLLQQISLQILESLLKTQDVPKAMQQLDLYLEKIVQNQLPLEDFLLSKSIRGSYVSENLPHVGALKRMQARGEECPPIGSRMHFYVAQGKPSDKLYDRTEHPRYFEEKKLQLDIKYYLESLYTPLEGLLKYVVDKSEFENLFQKYTDFIDNKSQTSLLKLLGNKRILETQEEIYEIKALEIKKPRIKKTEGLKKSISINTLKNYY